MNKGELVKTVADRSGLTQKNVAIALDAILDAISGSIASGDKVSLVGFGTFEQRDRKGRAGRNPATGEAINIPASRSVAFKPGQALKEAVKL